MKFMVTNRYAVENTDVLPNVDHIVVSISTPNDPNGLARIRENMYTHGVLSLQFYDVDRLIDGYNEEMWQGRFTEGHAEKVLAFIAWHCARHPNAMLVVHCDGGLSRSPAVAAAISRIVDGNDDDIFQCHSGLNRFVYRTLLETHAQMTNSVDGW